MGSGAMAGRVTKPALWYSSTNFLIADLARVQNDQKGARRSGQRGSMRSHGGGRVMRVGRVMARLESVAALLGEMLGSGPRLASKRKSGGDLPATGTAGRPWPSGTSQRDQPPRPH